MAPTECTTLCITRTCPWALAASLFFGCGDDVPGPSDVVGDGSGDGDVANDDDAGPHALGSIPLPDMVEWTDVDDVQFFNGPNRVEVWAWNARRELIGRIILEDFGARIVVSSEYADGSFAVEVFPDQGPESYFNVIHQTLGDEELTARAAAIEDLLYSGAAPSGKWLACGAVAASVVPACVGPWALLACIPAAVVAGCKCTKAALDLPNEKAGVCENV